MFHVEQSIAFRTACRANGVEITSRQLELFVQYAELLSEWNAKLNLVSRKNEQNLWASHFLHSISPLFGRSVADRLSLLDIGTGGGLPGIPLAILKERWSVTLMDSIAKKVFAVQDIVGRMGLKNVGVVNGRVEDAAVMEEGRGKFQMVIARGVAPLVQLAKWSRPYLAKGRSPVVGGISHVLPVPSLVAFKGGDLEGELRELRVKVPGAVAWVCDLVFTGSGEAGLEGKKLVVVQFT
jgi:16S rRNA (guanine527-N7)-methyltransferase